jgi:hypothetical protein
MDFAYDPVLSNFDTIVADVFVVADAVLAAVEMMVHFGMDF